MAKKKLSDYLQCVLQLLNLKQADLAKAAEITEPTLSRWITDNRFNPKCWNRIVAHLVLLAEREMLARNAVLIAEREPLKQVKLKDELNGLQDIIDLPKDWASVQKAFEVEDFRDVSPRRKAESESERLPSLESLYGKMGKGDVYVFHSLNITPLEFRSLDLQKLIVKGVKAGAYYLYVFISDSTIDTLSDLYQSRNLKRASDIEKSFDSFLDDLYTLSPETDQIRSQVRSVNIDLSPFMMHRETIAVFWLTEGDNTTNWVTQRLAKDTISEPPITLPVDKLFIGDFSRFVAKVHPFQDCDDLPLELHKNTNCLTQKRPHFEVGAEGAKMSTSNKSSKNRGKK